MYKVVPSGDGLPSSGEGVGGEPPEGEDGLSGGEAGGIAPEYGGGLSRDNILLTTPNWKLNINTKECETVLKEHVA